MNQVEKWYKEAVLECLIHETSKEFFIIRRGLRISKTKENTHYRIQDIRECEYYSEVSIEDYNQLLDKGFIKGCDYIGFNRDTSEVYRLQRLIEALYNKKKRFKRLLRKDKRLNLKRIRNLYKNIDLSIDQMFLYKSRIEQFNKKYNKN